MLLQHAAKGGTAAECRQFVEHAVVVVALQDPKGQVAPSESLGGEQCLKLRLSCVLWAVHASGLQDCRVDRNY